MEYQALSSIWSWWEGLLKYYMWGQNQTTCWWPGIHSYAVPRSFCFTICLLCVSWYNDISGFSVHATINSSQLKIDLDLFLKFNLSMVSSSKSKCCLKKVMFAILDFPLSTLPGFLLVKFCLFLKFLNLLWPGPVSTLNLFRRSLFLAIHKQKL